MARSKDKVALTRVLGTLAVGHSERSFEDPFLHTLVSNWKKWLYNLLFLLVFVFSQVAYLIPMADEFSNEMFCTVVFDEFFFTAIAKENVVRHMTK